MTPRTDSLLNKVCKWRMLFTGWQLGTRPDDDPEAQAVKDARELLILLRIECSALVGILIEKGVCTGEEWDIALGDEAAALDAAYERRFPGVEASLHGLVFDASRVGEIQSWMAGWKP